MNNNQTKGFVMPTITDTKSNFVFGKPTTFGQQTTQPIFPTTFGQQTIFPQTQTQTQAQPTFPQPTFPQTQTQQTQPTFPQPTQTIFPQTQTQPTFPQPTQTIFPQTQTTSSTYFSTQTQTQTQTQQTQPIFPPTTFQTQTIFPPPTTFQIQPTQAQTQPIFTPFTQPQTQPIFPPTTFQPQSQTQPIFQAETKSTQFPTTTQAEIEDYLFSPRYNKDAIFKSDHSIHINTGLKIFTFNFDYKIKNNMYKLKEKDTGIEIVIRFENKSPEFTEEEIHTLKIRPVGKTLFNHYKNKYENCSFIEPCDGTIYKYFTKMKELIGQREFGSLKLDIPKVFQIVEQLRKNMVSLFELNNQYVYTNLTLDNIVYRCKNNNLNETEFKLLLDHNVYPIDGVNKYVCTYPPYEMKTGIIVLDNKEKKEQTLSWYIGILLVMFLARHIPEFNSLNWIINDVSATDLNKLKLLMFSFYGEKYSNYISNIPSERPSIYSSIE